MKNFLFLFLIVLLFPLSASAKAPINKYFDTLNVLSERNLSLNDSLEFTVFDLSNMVVENEVTEIKDLVTVHTPAPEQPAPSTSKKNTANKITKQKQQAEQPKPEDTLAPAFKDLARFFYQNLKKEIVAQQVPVTLAAANLPAYAKPLSLSIRVDKIQFGLVQVDKKGVRFAPVTLAITGDLKNKQTDEQLLTFSDSCETILPINNTQPQTVLNQMANLLMRDFALFLKTQY